MIDENDVSNMQCAIFIGVGTYRCGTGRPTFKSGAAQIGFSLPTF